MAGTHERAEPPTHGERIAKALARAGVASRREAERMVEEGRVHLNGQPVTHPATLVGPDDRMSVDGKAVAAPDRPRLWRYAKPAGLVTTHHDPENRPTVFENLPPGLPRVISVGRLDLNSEGLLLLTNDGELARALEMPSRHWPRRYRVRVYGYVDPRKLESLAKGCVVDGVRYGPIEARLETNQDLNRQERTGAASDNNQNKPRQPIPRAFSGRSGNSWLIVTLHEGKNREIRKVLASLGLQVNRLVRLSYGPFRLGALRPSELEEVPGKVIADAVGKHLPGLKEAMKHKNRTHQAGTLGSAGQAAGGTRVPGTNKAHKTARRPTPKTRRR
ncbi:rRNA pseudouridine synthase [Formicincola oecophyllae]|uniref:Pseudouridine synthase n=1 Tax=Formicincola oecophyllae TaxID=2558361 RepID=A0A4Y6U9Z7_9PROT|nr:pseudouridine synthase [Formicincola oecophyllae]QDH14309.1 rRNA pseudouridine synthase [Formicincola oecophyllae]